MKNKTNNNKQMMYETKYDKLLFVRYCCNDLSNNYH